MKPIPGKLYLIPVPIVDNPEDKTLPIATLEAIKALDFFIVENAKVARKHLKQCNINKPLSTLSIQEITPDLATNSLEPLLEPIYLGHSIGLMSDAGCPAVADPGAKIVSLAHHLNIDVIPMVGPSSILLALMGSGLNGQKFTFNGYLPVNEIERQKTLKSLELRSKQHNETQLFIETPYRNETLFRSMISNLRASTLLTIAVDLTAETQNIKTKTVQEWRNTPPHLQKIPTIFLFLAQ